MGIIGADVEALHRLGRDMADHAGAIEDLIGGLTSGVDSLGWRGPDADKFREQWASEQAVAVRHLTQTLRTTSQQLQAHAEDQVRVSS